MAQPTLHLLSTAEKEQINATALDLLRTVGMKIDNDEALDLLGEAGAHIDRTDSRVRFPEALIERALEQAPAEITLYGRDIEDAITLKPGAVFYTTNGYAVQMIDPASGERRPVTQADLAWLTRLTDWLPHFDIYSVLATPDDAPPETNDRYQMAIALLNTTRHIWNTAYGADGVCDAVAMAAAIRGGHDVLRQYPLFTLDLTTLSPFQLDERQSSTMIEGARQGVPISISPGPIAGATGPVTLAGTIAQGTAEVLGAITLVQVVQPGTPVVMTQYTRSMDMSLGSVTMGGPEFSLMRVATAEMARFYNLPSRGGAMITDAKTTDAQLGAEKMLGCLMASLAGLNILAGGGQADFINTVRPDLLLIDNEIIGAVKHLLKGIAVTPETLARDVMAEIGPNGNYLAHDHTAAHFREELWFPDLWDRQNWTNWEAAGSKDVSARAQEKIQAANIPISSLDTVVEERIWDIVREADRHHVNT